MRQTPVLDLDGASLGLDHALTLKLELLQHTGSFKPRGAFNTLLSRRAPAAGVVAASGGNHGAAVGFAAARLGISARIYAPAIAGATKLGLIRATGAALEVVEGTYAEAAAAAEAWAAESGAMPVHAYDAPATLEGQGTVAAEFEHQAPGLDILLIAVGGGGLIGGIAAWYAGRVRVVAVEPEQAATLATALRDGPEATIRPGGIAANSLGAARIGGLCHRIVTALGVESVTVPDAAIADAQRRLWAAARIGAEPGGATALAALTSGAFRPPPGARVGVLVCGGNLDPAPFG